MRRPERASEPLVLELAMVIRFLKWMLETELSSSARAVPALNIWLGNKAIFTSFVVRVLFWVDSRNIYKEL